MLSRIVHKLERSLRALRYQTGLEKSLYPAKKSGDLCVVYHNVFEKSDTFFNVRNIGSNELRQQLRYLKKRFEPVFASSLFEPGDGKKRVAITFDDGLINNLHHALPILEELEFPATFFACSPYLHGRSMLWPDRISMLGRLGARELHYDRKVYKPDLRNTFRDAQGNKLSDQLRKLPVDNINTLLDAEEERLRIFVAEHTQEEDRFRIMKAEELKIFASSPFVELGVHGVEHEVFTQLDDAALLQVLQSNKQYLQSASGKPVTTVAFPYGLYDLRVVDLCIKAGLHQQFGVADGPAHPAVKTRVGCYNDRSWIEQLHQLNLSFHA